MLQPNEEVFSARGNAIEIEDFQLMFPDDKRKTELISSLESRVEVPPFVHCLSQPGGLVVLKYY